MRRAGVSKEQVAERSKHPAARVLALFDQPEPNPTLQIYLDLLEAAGARFNGASDNTSAAVVARLKEIIVRENISISALARSTGITRPQLSTLFNAPDPNPMLARFDQLVVALGVEKELCLVAVYSEAVRLATVVGGDTVAEFEAARENAANVHLHVVPAPWESREDALRRAREANAARIAAERRLEEATAKMDALNEQLTALHEQKVALEKQQADSMAEIDRLAGANRALVKLRDEQNAEIAQLRATQGWTVAEKVKFGLGCALAGAGVTIMAIQIRR